MEHAVLIVILACFGAFFMAFNNGANDVANAFASAVGSKAITVKQALIIAATLNFIGAVLLGSGVATTLLESVIRSDIVIEPKDYVLGMIASLMASGTFVLLSTMTGMPVSSTHAIVGSLAGVGIVIGGFGAVNWAMFGVIALSWIISPVIASAFAWSSIRFVRKQIYKGWKKGKLLKRVQNVVPLFIGATMTLLPYFIMKRPVIGIGTFESSHKWLFSLSLGILSYFLTRNIIGRWMRNVERSEEGAEHIFKKLQVGTACYVAFGHGSNDVANSISPVLGIFLVIATGRIPAIGEAIAIPLWLLGLGGFGMAFGIWVLGHKVIATLGKNITLMTNSKGFCVDFATATTVTLATILGMPISTTHAATGSVIGVALDKGKHALNYHILLKIFFAWIITVPAAAILTIGFYWILRLVF